MPDFIRDVRPAAPNESYRNALGQLQASKSTLIAHIDAGLAPHPTFGPVPGPEQFPEHVLIGQGRNLFDPGGTNGDRPISPLTRSTGPGAKLIEFPDHGVKTLSVILGETAKLAGLAQRVRVVPYRISNGPLFRAATGGPFCRSGETRRIGMAIDHALQTPTVRVMSISMGNPGFLGPLLEPVRQFFGGEIGMKGDTGKAVDRAYDAGVIIVCAAGQVIDRVVYPARYDRTIGVGGFDQDRDDCNHYPSEGYDRWEAIDVWAQAARINRASFDLNAAPPTPIHADDPRNEGDPSGTSYACPQVAAAAALWFEAHRAVLTGGGFAADPWKIVEAFRLALHDSASPRRARLGGGKMVPIRALNVPALIATPVIEPPDSARRTEAAKQGFW